MKWSEWRPIYLEIVREMGYSVEADREAAALLDALIGDRSITIDQLKNSLTGYRVAVIFGAGPSLERDLERFLGSGLAGRAAVMAADGASAALLNSGLIPHIVVTDLDGGDETLLRASRLNAVMAVHAHGDNLAALIRLVPLFEGPLLGTTQAEPRGALYNFGGFTDGDRAVFLADALNFETIILAGMDLGESVGKYSKSSGHRLNPRFIEAKRRKLRIAKKLLELYASTSSRRLYNATAQGAEIKGFKRIGFKELADHLP